MYKFIFPFFITIFFTLRQINFWFCQKFKKFLFALMKDNIDEKDMPRKLKIETLSTLDGNNELSDDVVDSAIELFFQLKKKFQINNKEKMGFVPSYIFQTLSGNSFKNFLYYSVNNCLDFHNDKILCPALIKGKVNHWILLEIDSKIQNVRIYNSLKSYVLNDCVQTGIKNLIIALNIMRNPMFGTIAFNEQNPIPYSINFEPNTPQQEIGSSDCGVAVICNARSVLFNKPLIKGKNLKNERENIKEMLINNCLGDDVLVKKNKLEKQIIHRWEHFCNLSTAQEQTSFIV